MLKAARGGYDGKGVWPVADATEAAAVLSHVEGRVVVEELLPLDAELAVMVARRPSGFVRRPGRPSRPHRWTACAARCWCPGASDREVVEAATGLGQKVAEIAGAVGVMAIELFWSGGRILVNEVATRPHNSGHWTIEGAVTSQFENHVRAVLDLPLGSTAPQHPQVASVNVFGGPGGADPSALLARGLAVEGAHVHLYGKDPRPGRKLGHVTVCGDDAEVVRAQAPGRPRGHSARPSRPGSPCPGGRLVTAAPLVAVVMGSSSDLPVMQGAVEMLERFGVAHEVRVVSAHRTPREMLAFGQEAAGRGVKVIIAGAGGAAHLPGMLASVTPLPVIGVPVALSQLDGLDSLLSIVQMPKGVPVATVAVNGARNAGLLAVRILGLGDPELAARMVAFQDEIASDARPGRGRVRRSGRRWLRRRIWRSGSATRPTRSW